MKSLLKVLVGVVAGLAALMLISGLAIRLLLSSSAKDSVLASLESRLKAPVSIEGGDFDLAQWFRFTPAITLRGFSIGNPEGFSSGKLLEAEEVSAQVALLSLFSSPIEVHNVVLRRPQLNLETNRQGQSNIGTLVGSSADAGGAGQPKTGSSTAVAIRGLSLEDGTVRYVEAGAAEPLTIDEINLKLSDFAADTSCRFQLSGRLFGSNHSRIGFDGNAGPFSSASIPAKGDLRLDLAPGEIPAAIRQKYFGDVLADPGNASRVAVQADVDGDLLAALRGKGKLSFADFQAGRDSQHRVEVFGEAPLDLTAHQVLGKPAIDLATTAASLKLGSGQWKGNAEFHFADSRLRGKINGAISGVDINELLSAFSEAGGEIFGTAQMQEIELSFTGANSEALLNSLAGHGTITMENGRIAALDVFNSVMTQAQKMLSSETAAAGQTSFARFFSRWQIGDQRLRLSDMQLESGASSLSGDGFLGFNHELNFDLRTTFTGELASALRGRPNAQGVPTAQIPVKVSGTLDAPRVRPDVAQAAKEQVQERVTGLLDSLFKKKSGAQPK